MRVNDFRVVRMNERPLEEIMHSRACKTTVRRMHRCQKESALPVYYTLAHWLLPLQHVLHKLSKITAGFPVGTKTTTREQDAPGKSMVPPGY